MVVTLLVPLRRALHLEQLITPHHLDMLSRIVLLTSLIVTDCRAAQVHDFVARAISGHATAELQQLYSTAGGEEVRAGLAKVISLAGFRQEQAAGGYPGGYREADKTKAG